MSALVDTPYAGMLDGRPYPHDSPHLLVSGRTGSSKTRSVLAVQVASWGPRPVVAVSSKGDIARMTAERRNKLGPCYLMDLAGEVSDATCARLGLTRVASDPCALITDDDSAIELAALLQEVGTVGAGDGKGGGDAFWMSLAEETLAGLLTAAGWWVDPATGEDRWGGGIAWARRAARNIGNAAPGTDDEDAPLDFDTPSWDTAALRCATVDSIWGESIVNDKLLDSRQRDSIAINLRVATKAWGLRKVSGRGRNSHARYRPFTPDMLTGAGTLYITSPLSGTAAPAATATLTFIVNHWRDLHRDGEPDPGDVLLMVVDECPSTAPLPRLRAWIADLRSYGVRLVAACQASSQFGPREGEMGLRIIRDTMPGILILPGAPEREILEYASWATLPEERVAASTGADGRVSHSRDRIAGMEGSELLPRTKGEALLIVGGMVEKFVDLVDINHTDVYTLSDRPDLR